MSELINTSPKDNNQISLQNRIKNLFDNDHVFWTALILWFIPVFLALPLLSSTIPDVEVIVVQHSFRIFSTRTLGEIVEHTPPLPSPKRISFNLAN